MQTVTQTVRFAKPTKEPAPLPPMRDEPNQAETDAKQADILREAAKERKGSQSAQFDFDHDSVSCQSSHITLAPVDKVLRVRFGAHGSRFFEKAVVKKVTPKRVIVDIRLKGRETGNVLCKPVSVDRWYLYRHNWKDAVVSA